jgi:Domain of unknown function (DUF4190)
MPDDFEEHDSPSDGPAPERPVRRRARRSLDDDDWDDDDRPRIRRDLPPDDGMSTLIPYKNPKALIAYYLGVFGLIPILGFVLAIVAVILGFMGLKYAKQHPTAKGTGHAIVGIVLGGISVLYHLSCIGLIVFGAIMSSKR